MTGPTEASSGRADPGRQRFLFLQAYDGGSHRAFLDAVLRHSRHDWSVLRRPAMHWKWRMRSAALGLADEADRWMSDHGAPDAVLCTDMLDVPAWSGLVRDPRWQAVPIVTYFHENQWMYPVAPGARVDSHYGYTNLLSAIASDGCFFNSDFHREAFLRESELFVNGMPDSASDHDFESLRRKSSTVYPGFEPAERQGADHRRAGPLRIGWVSRWEHDKRPDRFASLLNRLADRGMEFQLILLGPRPRRSCENLESIRNRHPRRIVHDGFADADNYQKWIHSIDVVVSTADHEFFGIAVCEAISAGAVPVLPNRLSYPELVSTPTLYDDLDQAADLIVGLDDDEVRYAYRAIARKDVQRFRCGDTIRSLDSCLTKIVVG
ncbi:MAG: DUF3524 domain-containing protein [Planctomycetota bacterium]